MRRWIPVAATFATVLALDQLSKAIVRHDVGVGEENSVFPAVSIVHVKNTGVAFGFGSGTGGLVVAGTLIALAGLLVFFARSRPRPGLWLPTGLLLGGAVGNLLDRARLGAVTDFVKLPAWPAFNVADVAITVGVLSLLYVLEGPKSHGD